MKVRLTTNCEYSYLIQADEIKVKWKDRRIIEDLAKKYPQADIVLEHNNLLDEEVNWTWIKQEEILIKKSIIMCLYNLPEAMKAIELNLKFYLNYPITSYYELQGIATLNPCYIKVGSPLFFELEKVKRFNIPIMATPNIAYEDGYLRDNGVLGTWILPQMLNDYENLIDIIEFFTNNDKKKEQSLYRIYINNDGWKLDVKDLITNFNYEGSNSVVLKEGIEKRINCGQRCLSHNSCSICYRVFDIANREKLAEYKEALKNNTLEKNI